MPKKKDLGTLIYVHIKYSPAYNTKLPTSSYMYLHEYHICYARIYTYFFIFEHITVTSLVSSLYINNISPSHKIQHQPSIHHECNKEEKGDTDSI